MRASSTNTCRMAAAGYSVVTSRPSDITMATVIAFSKFPVNAMPLDERFEHIDAFWRRWLRRPTLLAAYADRNSGVPELDT
jgi:glutathione S-transferase